MLIYSSLALLPSASDAGKQVGRKSAFEFEQGSNGLGIFDVKVSVNLRI